MARPIVIDEGLALQANSAAAGEACPLKQVATDSSNQDWRVVLTPRTVYLIEALHFLAVQHNARIAFDLSANLTDAERAFVQDYQTYRLPTPRNLAARSWKEWSAAVRETVGALTRLNGKPRPDAQGDTLERVVIIGAYGGDHIGDAAILAGVLLDLHRRHGVKNATVLSGRPGHTARLVAGLSLPLQVDVEDYRPETVDRLLDRADALVLGGGPLFDAPRMLARHLAAVESAKARSKPFFVERIGLTPFHNPFSKWAARRVLETAAKVSVRSAAAADHPLMAGIAAECRRDPAYDYLQTRQTLDRLSGHDKEDVAALLAGADQALKVAINLRPTHDSLADQAAGRRPAVDEAFTADFARALAEFAAKHEGAVRFIAFPMNALQLGMSDLSAFHELQRAAGRSVDLRVWWGDPGLDGVLHLLQHVDLAVTMRFHATIFAQSQNVPVIGVDYFPEPGGKVSKLLAESGASDDAITVGRFSAEWLVDRLQRKAESVREKAAV